MLISLKLKNFKKHEDLSINFTEGLNAIRGDNEKGKSTIVHAIGYAYYGARALPMSLDETVTWGKPVNSLKVELVFLHDGEMYTLTRSKSGAELVGTSVQSSGQTEVTAFIERLFGASATVGQATMLANQSALQAGLDASSTALIEKLANMSLIDDLVSKIQDQLPTGSTKLLESRLNAALEVQVPKPFDNTLDTEAAAVRKSVEEANAKVANLELVEGRLKPIAEDAAARISHNKSTAAREARLKEQLQSLPSSIEIPKAPDLSLLEAAAEKQAEQLKARKAWVRFKGIPHQNENYGTVEDFEKEAKDVAEDLARLTATKQEIFVRLAGLKPLLITQTVCGLCEKDLSNVPEVVKKNSEVYSKISKAEVELAAVETAICFNVREREAKVEKLKLVLNQVKKFFGAEFVKFDVEAIPPKASWVGPNVEQEVDDTDYAKKIKECKQLLLAAQSAKDKATRFEAARELLQKQLEEVAYLEIAEEDLRAIPQLENTRSELKQAEALRKSLQDRAATAEAQAYRARLEHEAAVKAYEKTLATQEEIKKDLAEYARNNALVKRLRDVRPAVAKKLWNIVLAAVSHYFSSVRGVQSVVGREGSGFTIDGKAVEAYSGSTRDALALAVRVVLQKTFLPSIDFALLDEVASACDDNRESDMLAMLSTCGLKQVLLVTHSDLADSYAANVIRI